MKALPTQFDKDRLSSAVATPTCSSCCCCCCCLATTISTSSLLAQKIGKEGELHQVKNRHLLTVLAALFVPIVAVLVYMGYWIINIALGGCITDITQPLNSCSDAGLAYLIPLVFIVPLLTLWFLYSSVKIEYPLMRAVQITGLIAVAVIGEALLVAPLVFTGVGGIIYLISIPIIVGWISVWYHKRIAKDYVDEEVSEPGQSGASDNAGAGLVIRPTASENIQHDDDTPQPTPPTTSGQ